MKQAKKIGKSRQFFSNTVYSKTNGFLQLYIKIYIIDQNLSALQQKISRIRHKTAMKYRFFASAAQPHPSAAQENLVFA